jgi:hypothetical protein
MLIWPLQRLEGQLSNIDHHRSQPEWPCMQPRPPSLIRLNLINTGTAASIRLGERLNGTVIVHDTNCYLYLIAFPP